MNIKTVALTLIISGTICSTNAATLRADRHQNIIKTLCTKADTVFSIDRKQDGSIAQGTPLKIDLSGQELHDCSVLTTNEFEELVMHQYEVLTGDGVTNIAAIPIELNLSGNNIPVLAYKSLAKFTLRVLIVDKHNVLNPEIMNIINKDEDVMVLWV